MRWRIYNIGINVCSKLEGFEFFVFSICQKQTKPDVIKCVNKSSVRSQLFSRARRRAMGDRKYIYYFLLRKVIVTRPIGCLRSLTRFVVHVLPKIEKILRGGTIYRRGQCSGNHHESEFYVTLDRGIQYIIG